MKTNLNSTRLEDHAEISIIENPEQPKAKPKLLEKPAQNTPRLKPQLKTPSSKTKISSSIKSKDIQPSPSVLTKKRPSPKSNKKKLENEPVHEDSSVLTPRPRRNMRQNQIIDSDDETNDKENEFETDFSSDTSYSQSDLLTDDENDDDYEVPKPKSVRKNAPGTSTTKKSSRKNKKNDLIFLDLSSEEVVEVNENHHANVSEEDLANITQKFLETDLNKDE